jgi:hypothetical protein
MVFKGKDPEGAEVNRAARRQGRARSGWKRYGIEAHTCLALSRGCERSIGYGAVLELA